VLAGSGTVGSGFNSTATGGVTLTGTATASTWFDTTATGGLSLTGTGSVGMGAVTIVRTAAGGITLTGTAYPSSSARLPRFIDLEQRPTLTLTLRN
jgi:hypothetical protein